MDTTVLAIIAAIVSAIMLLRKKKSPITSRAKRAQQLATWSKAAGLGQVASLLDAYADHDAAGMVAAFRTIPKAEGASDLSGEVLLKFMETQLNKLLDKPKGREELIDNLEEKLGTAIEQALRSKKQ